MPDISKCSNEECPLKEKCYRWTAKDSEPWQSYTKFQFKKRFDTDYVDCDDLIIKTNLLGFTEMVKNEELTKVLKGLDAIKNY